MLAPGFSRSRGPAKVPKYRLQNGSAKGKALKNTHETPIAIPASNQQAALWSIPLATRRNFVDNTGTANLCRFPGQREIIVRLLDFESGRLPARVAQYALNH